MLPRKKGTEPLVAPKKYAKQMGRSTDHLLGFIDGDGRPFVVPISPQVTDGRISVAADRLPTGGRRASVMGLWFNPQLHGQGMWAARGWLDVTSSDATFAPSASNGFNLSMGAFGQKVLVPIVLGFATGRPFVPAPSAMAGSSEATARPAADTRTAPRRSGRDG